MSRVVKKPLLDRDKESTEEIFASYELFSHNEQLMLFNQLPDAILMLNHNRQIVYFNHSFLDYASSNDPQDIIGLRPGDIFKCIHACENGCGGSRFCTQCGAARAIIDSLRDKDSSYECCLTSTDGHVYNFRVWARPHLIGDEVYSMFIIRNIATEKSNSLLEQVLFHDVSNVALGVNGLLDIIDGSHEHFDKYSWLLNVMSRELVDTIHNQKFLMQAEHGLFLPKITELNSYEIINEVIHSFEYHPSTDGKNLNFKGSEDVIFYSDRQLMKHIIRVMVKNALEASDCGQEITLTSKSCGDKILFQVHNHGCIDSNVQLNIFKRSFSTKGSGHGWGAYGIKMLSEEYLHGQVWFATNKQTGTTFFAEYPIQTHIGECNDNNAGN